MKMKEIIQRASQLSVGMRVGLRLEPECQWLAEVVRMNAGSAFPVVFRLLRGREETLASEVGKEWDCPKAHIQSGSYVIVERPELEEVQKTSLKPVYGYQDLLL